MGTFNVGDWVIRKSTKGAAKGAAQVTKVHKNCIQIELEPSSKDSKLKYPRFVKGGVTYDDHVFYDRPDNKTGQLYSFASRLRFATPYEIFQAKKALGLIAEETPTIYEPSTKGNGRTTIVIDGVTVEGTDLVINGNRD